MDPDGVPAGEGSLPRRGGHERLLRLQGHAEAGRVGQPGVPAEDGLPKPDLPEASVRQTGPAGRSPARPQTDQNRELKCILNKVQMA